MLLNARLEPARGLIRLAHAVRGSTRMHSGIQTDLLGGLPDVRVTVDDHARFNPQAQPRAFPAVLRKNRDHGSPAQPGQVTILATEAKPIDTNVPARQKRVKHGI